MSCSRSDAQNKETMNNYPENMGYYGYVTNPNSQIRAGSTCVGSGAGANQVCDRSVPTRRPVGGANGIGDPVLIQRSYKSSGCPPTESDFNSPDTLSQHVVFANTDKWNKGSDMTAFSTRSFQSNAQNVGEKDISMYYLTKPTEWSSGYHGLAGIGENVSTRLVSGCHSASKYARTTNDPLSASSYGSYGMVSARP